MNFVKIQTARAGTKSFKKCSHQKTFNKGLPNLSSCNFIFLFWYLYICVVPFWKALLSDCLDFDTQSTVWQHIPHELLLTTCQKKIHPFASAWYKIGLPWAMIIYFKSALMLFFKYCDKRYGLGLTNEQLFIITAQGAAKLWPVKFGGPNTNLTFWIRG